MATVKTKRTRSSTACTRCRRMKVRCDVADRFPNKCTRCERVKVFCELDRQLRKVSLPSPSNIMEPGTASPPTTATTSNTTSPLSHTSPCISNLVKAELPLTSNLSRPPITDNITQMSALAQSTTTIPVSTTANSSASTPLNTTSASTLYSDHTTENQILPDGTLIPATVIDKLFDLFMKYQYHYLPIFPKRYLTPPFLLLNSDATLPTLHGLITIPTTTSPVLFWTICAVACPMAYHQDLISRKMWDSITDHVRVLLQKHSMVTHYVLRPFTALAHIYALVVLCEWPLPHRTTQEDLTWIYSGQAVHIGLLVGLHRSWFKSEFVIMESDNSNYESVNGEQQQQQNGNDSSSKTTRPGSGTTNNKADQSRARMHALMWMACFHMNQRLASIHGVPATATLDYALLAKFNDDIKKNSYRTRTTCVDVDDNDIEEALSEFVKQVHILHLLNRCINTLGIDTDATHDYTSTLGSNRKRNIEQQSSNGMLDPSYRRLVHSSLEATLSQLGVDYSPMSPMTELIFLHTKVQLHSFLLAPDTLDRDKRWVVSPISIVCMQILQLVQLMLLDDKKEDDRRKGEDDGDGNDIQPSQEEQQQQQQRQQNDTKTPSFHTWPNFVVRTVLISSMILFQLSISKYQDWLDREAVQKGVIQARSIMDEMTWSPTCPAARGVRVLDGLAVMVSAGALNCPSDMCFSQSRLGSGYWGIVMAYKKWLMKQQKRQQQQQQQQHIEFQQQLQSNPSEQQQQQQLEKSDEAVTTNAPTFVSPGSPAAEQATSSTAAFLCVPSDQQPGAVYCPTNIPLHRTLSTDNLFNTTFNFDDNDTLINWNDLSWLDTYTP
ncbi:hypothetical protein BCR42DRAFT_450824 [Absidia repens]|uniref:Zn(2)-C6 fungal-type domain-containing protein n=1 Tax=Absidia repens TaxID=90262 RepID=A0A1X2II37_9FUNG|nr:hypothetical protein BCR42DRAFT_450824 [Absidia repens]